MKLPLGFAKVIVRPVVWNEQGGAGEGRGGVGRVEFVAYLNDASKVGPLSLNVPLPEGA